MGVARKAAENEAERTITQERVFDAPRELVWKVWTDPKHVDKWWGPNGFRNQTHSHQLRVGAEWKYTMHGPDGKAWPNWVQYEEISKPERLVYMHGADSKDPNAFRVTVTFTEQAARTKVTMTTLLPTAENAAAAKKFGAVEGGQQTLARLAGYLPYAADGSAEQSMVVTRLYDAPPKLVFDAWTKPESLKRWWGPKGFTLTVAEIDFRSGGAYRMSMRGPDGIDVPFHGHFKEIVPNRRIVFNAILEIEPRADVTATVTFDEENGKTRLTVRQDIPANPAAGEGQMQGWSETLEKLAAART